MSVRVATSNQSQALTRSLAGSTAAPRQDPGDASFDGVLSNVADDHASGAQPSGTMPDKDAAGAKTPPNGTPAFPTDATAAATAARDASSAATASASVLSLASLAGDAAAAWTGSTGTSTSSAKVKMNHADAAKAAPGDSGPSPTSTDPSATPAGLSPQLSLLALVQSAAALPSSDPSAGPASDTASSNATVAATQVLSNGTPPLSGDQKGASAGPLISDVTFQTYLAPVSTAVAPSVPPALPQAATPDTTPLLADAKPQSDVSTNVALGALIAPLAQAAVGKQAVGSFDTAVGPSSTDSSSGGKAAIAQIGAVASLFQDLGNVLPLRGGIPASSPVQTDTPTPDSAPTNAAIPTGPAQFSAGGSDAVSVPPVSAPSVSDPLVSAAPVAVPLVSAPSVSDPLVSAAPVAAPPVSAPPVSDPLVSAALVAAPPVLAPPVSDPLVSAAPVAAPPVSAVSMSVPLAPASSALTSLAASQSAGTTQLASIVTAQASGPQIPASVVSAASLAVPPVAAPQASAAPALAPLDAASVDPAASNAPLSAASGLTASGPSVPTPSDAARTIGGPVTAPMIDATIGTPIVAALPVPLQPVADAITSLAAQSAGPPQASTDPSSRLSPARTMLLQLNPGELGTVSVRLHLTGRTLDVSLTASQDQTAALLDHGRDALTRAIGDQDYQVNALVIQRGDPQRGDTNSLPGSPNATSTNYSRDQAASQGGGDASGGSSRQGADGAPSRQNRSDRQPQPRAAPAARGSGLFL